MSKIKITLESEDHDYLIVCLENYLESLNDAESMRAVVHILEQVEENIEDVEE